MTVTIYGGKSSKTLFIFCKRNIYTPRLALNTYKYNRLSGIQIFFWQEEWEVQKFFSAAAQVDVYPSFLLLITFREFHLELTTSLTSGWTSWVFSRYGCCICILTFDLWAHHSIERNQVDPALNLMQHCCVYYSWLSCMLYYISNSSWQEFWEVINTLFL